MEFLDHVEDDGILHASRQVYFSIPHAEAVVHGNCVCMHSVVVTDNVTPHFNLHEMNLVVIL